MKQRFGFVSNSSSTSFVIDFGKMSQELKSKIDRMHDRSDDCSRCTGKITDLKEWANMLLEDDEEDPDFIKVKSYAKNPDIIMIRESDEGMGGSFIDYCFSYENVKPFVLYEFEFH
jgi:hypothetical protein